MSLKPVYLAFIACLMAVHFCNCSGSASNKQSEEKKVVVADSTYDVFLVAGQSNAYYGTGYDSLLDKPSAGIYQLGRNESDMKIIAAKEPLHHFNPKPERIGFSLTFAKEYQKYINGKRDILIVPCAMDNSGFEGDGWNKGNYLYNTTLDRVNYVMTHYPKSKFVAVLWAQGEKDVNYKGYQSALDTFIVLLRREIVGADKNTPFIMGGMVPFWTEKNKARIHQKEILEDTKNRLPNIGYVDPYKPFKIGKPDNMKDTIHYDAAGQREMGKRYFEEFKKLAR